jgi:hypothetical protein
VHGENGFLVPPGDVHALCDRMQWCIDRPERLNRLARRIRPWRTFSEEARTFVDIYQALLAAAHTARPSSPG